MPAQWLAQLDPELEPVLAKLSPAMNEFVSLPADEALAQLAAVRAILRKTMADRPRDPASELVRAEEHAIPARGREGAIRVRTYRPIGRTGALPALVWFHGGGFHRGSLEQDEPLYARLAVDVGLTVISVGYRLAPEHPFPAGVDDCYAGLCWTKERADELDIDGERLAVGGRSGGGGIAAAVALMARDRKGPALRLQLLSQPMLDDRHQTPSSNVVLDTRLWNGAVSRWAWNAYLGATDRSAVSPYAAPSRTTDLAGVAPAYLLVAGLDILRDEGVEYAKALIGAGVTTELHVVPGVFHGFDGSAANAAVAKRVRAEYVEVLRAALGARP